MIVPFQKIGIMIVPFFGIVKLQELKLIRNKQTLKEVKL